VPLPVGAALDAPDAPDAPVFWVDRSHARAWKVNRDYPAHPVHPVQAMAGKKQRECDLLPINQSDKKAAHENGRQRLGRTLCASGPPQHAASIISPHDRLRRMGACARTVRRSRRYLNCHRPPGRITGAQPLLALPEHAGDSFLAVLFTTDMVNALLGSRHVMAEGGRPWISGKMRALGTSR
jgi:hypothetical protein